MDPYIRVLLVEQEPDTVSVVSLFLSEIKECQLQICSSGEEALIRMPEVNPDLVLIAQGQIGRSSLEVLREIHQKYPNVYLIASLPESNPDSISSFMAVGANDCIFKDKNYVRHLVTAVKRALVRIAERQSISLPEMSRAEQVALDDNLPDLVFSLDPRGKLLYVNRAIHSLLGYEPKDVIGKTLFDLMTKNEEKLRLEKYLRHAGYESNFRGLIELQDRLGAEEEFEVNCTFMESEMIYGVARKKRVLEPLESIDEIAPIQEEREAPETSEEGMPARLGPYRVVTLLGAGAMGRVYQGFDEHLDRIVAIKVLSKALAADKQHLESFHHEAKTCKHRTSEHCSHFLLRQP